MTQFSAADPVVILSYARTPMGGMQGALSEVSATDLGATAVKAAVERSGVAPEKFDRTYMGCVLPAGLGQAPARQASIKAGLPKSVQATTVNKVCGSGMQTVIMGAEALASGTVDYVVAGGMESMTNAPYVLPKVRAGLRMGHGQVLDHMFVDGLEDAYDKGKLMGVFAEQCAEKYGFTRQQQDEFAIASLTRAQQAITDGTFAKEIEPIAVPTRKGEVTVSDDEQPGNANLEKIPTLKPAFKKDGTITPANASSISDGGAALVMMRRSEAERRGLTPLAVIHGHATHAQEPGWFTTAPVGAMKKLLDKVSWGVGAVDLFEVNEAFAVVTLAAMHELEIPHDKVNVHGGACALGHPVGASGARIIVTLINALQKYDLKRGVASLCIGGGEATAIAIERV